MTDEYKIIGGKAVLSSDEGMQERESVHNLEHILQLENKIEILSERLESAKEKRKKYGYKPIRRKKDRFLSSLFEVFGAALAVFVIVQLIILLSSGFNLEAFSEVTNTVFGPIKFWQFFTLVMEIIFIPCSILGESKMWSRENARVETVLGLEATIESLERDLANEEEALRSAKMISQSISSESGIVSLQSFNETYETAVDDKMDRISRLGTIRDELIRCVDDERLVERLKQKGLQSEDIEAAKAFVMKEKNRVYQ